jgi:hypothetical protein
MTPVTEMGDLSHCIMSSPLSICAASYSNYHHTNSLLGAAAFGANAMAAATRAKRVTIWKVFILLFYYLLLCFEHVVR